MTVARREIVNQDQIGAYHCTARCVRRAYLCGRDAFSGRNFDHRKDWARARLQVLASAFAMDIGAYAIMDNHLHVVIRVRPDLAKEWSAEEICRRWRAVFGKKPTSKIDRKSLEVRIELEALDSKLVAQRRERLTSVSWFMRCLCEPLAHRANQEDGCKGRFWEGRFRCQALLDDSALLACSAYVDLNPVRAGIAKTPESSTFTSVADRIAERQTRTKSAKTSREAWLSPMANKTINRSKPVRRASSNEWISLALDDYLQLLDWTGRQIRQDKKGAIPKDLAPILDRLKIQPDGWLGVVQNFGRWFKYAAGSSIKMRERAKNSNRKWLQGLTKCNAAFL